MTSPHSDDAQTQAKHGQFPDLDVQDVWLLGYQFNQPPVAGRRYPALNQLISIYIKGYLGYYSQHNLRIILIYNPAESIENWLAEVISINASLAAMKIVNFAVQPPTARYLGFPLAF
jgi:hypothetical protein